MSAKIIHDFSVDGRGHCTVVGAIITDYMLEILRNQGAVSITLQHCWLHTSCVKVEHSLTLDSCAYCVPEQPVTLDAPRITLWSSCGRLHLAPTVADFRAFSSSVLLTVAGTPAMSLAGSLANIISPASLSCLDLNSGFISVSRLTVGGHQFVHPRILLFNEQYNVLYDATHVLLGSDMAVLQEDLATPATEGYWWRRQVDKDVLNDTDEFPDAHHFWELEQLLAENKELLLK